MKFIDAPIRQMYITTGMRYGKTNLQNEFYKMLLDDQELEEAKNMVMNSVFKTQKEIDAELSRRYTNPVNYNKPKKLLHILPGINKVVFNPPATVVFWGDGTKTVVKAQNGETFDPEKGLAMAISKKALGNQGRYFNTIKKYANEYHVRNFIDDAFTTAPIPVGEIVFDSKLNPFDQLAKTLSGPWTFTFKKPGDDECQSK